MEAEKNIIVGPHFERSIYSSLGELFLLILKVHGDKVIQVDAITGEILPANLLLNRAILFAKWLQKNNIGPGDCISVISENCLDFCLVPVAAFLNGVTFAPFNPEYTTGELQHVLSLSKPKLIVCSPKTIEKVLSGKSNYPFVEKFILLGNNHMNYKNVTMFKDIIKDAKAVPVDDNFQPTPINPDENVALILCSSGTTGLPKGVMTTHSNITTYVEIATYVLEEYMNTQTEATERVMTGVAPFFHNMGFMLMILATLGGATLVVYPKFDPKQFLESIAKYKVTTLIVPPPIIVFLTKHPMVRSYDLSSIRDVRSGAAPLGKTLEKEALEKFNLEHVSQSYGMTETTLGVLMTRAHASRLGSVGQLVPGMKCKVIDNSGKALGPNEEGELCFQGPLIMKGYVGDVQATSNTIDKNKWLHTGDVGYYDNDGFFFVVDRIKELIKYKGFQVAPAELEALLHIHPAIADAAVVGVEDEWVGELPLAFVVKKSNYEVTAAELEKYVAEKVSTAKQLRGGVRFINEIPRNSSGKILRRVLRENAKKLRSKL